MLKTYSAEILVTAVKTEEKGKKLKYMKFIRKDKDKINRCV